MTRPGGPPMRDLTGERVGRLVVLWLVEAIPHGESWWLCECDCGGIKLARHRMLTRGHTRSCGCLKREASRQHLLNQTAERRAEWAGLIDTLGEIVTRFPQRAGELLAQLRDTWGSCQERRFWRALRVLVDAGRVEQQGNRYGSGDIPSTYSLPRQQRRAA